jgi:hypothetical protein
MRKDKKPKTFRHENGEECCPASLVVSAMMVIGSLVGSGILIAAICWSRHLYHCLFNH